MTILNDCSATRKDRIIDLTVTDSSFARKVNNWKVDEEIFLKSDHKLITFELGTVKIQKHGRDGILKLSIGKNGRLSVM